MLRGTATGFPNVKWCLKGTLQYVLLGLVTVVQYEQTLLPWPHWLGEKWGVKEGVDNIKGREWTPLGLRVSLAPAFPLTPWQLLVVMRKRLS